MKGFITFYVNFPEYREEIVKPMLQMIRNENEAVVSKLLEDGYMVIFFPTHGEACRVDKIDYDQPFPRFVAPHMDITKHEQMVANAIAATSHRRVDD